MHISVKKVSHNKTVVRLPSAFLFCLGFSLISWRATALARPKYELSGELSTRGAVHTLKPNGLASQRFDVLLEQKATFNQQWKGVFGFSAWNESAYAQQPEIYPQSLNIADSQDFRLRDAYLQYQSDHFFLRAGNQQVVWGEAFGYFYSDIVNPKDLRDGLFGDFSRVRLQVPMLNAKLIFSDVSFQALYLPQARFHLMPGPGSDYFPLKSVLPFQALEIQRETDLPNLPGNDEYGGRFNLILDGWDFSLFGFRYFDRSPSYTLSEKTVVPQKLVFIEQHDRVQSGGLTLTKDLAGFVVRLEGLRTWNKILPALQSNAATPDLLLSKVRSSNDVFVLGCDLPTNSDFNIGVQWSQDSLATPATGLLRSDRQTLFSVRLQRSLLRNHNLEFIYTRETKDQGQRTQLNYALPLSGKLETHFGFDILSGPENSEFGNLKSASRAYVLLKSFFKE